MAHLKRPPTLGQEKKTDQTDGKFYLFQILMKNIENFQKANFQNFFILWKKYRKIHCFKFYGIVYKYKNIIKSTYVLQRFAVSKNESFYK